MTLLLIRFLAFKPVDLDDPKLKQLPFWLRRCTEAVDINEVQEPLFTGDSHYIPPERECYEIEGYFRNYPEFYAIWTCSTNIKSVREEDSIQYDDTHPMLPWFDRTTPIEEIH